MADLSRQPEENQTLLLLAMSRSDKPYAYRTLLQLQECSSDDQSAIRSLCERLPVLLDLIRSDIFDDNEEIAAMALKCLGFMIYHPTVVSAIPERDANLVLESLVKLITSTKMKAVCNLGVWCISIQQFSVSFLGSQIHLLLRAVIHALDNPVGSLSITFEAIQAVMKLATQLSEKMKELSYIWAPPIYRRLLSPNKKERDISERCLQKIKQCILPPQLALSKAVAIDIKQKLLPEMKKLLQGQGCKVHAIQAWGWFVSLLGSYAIKNRHLVNEMLKIPEQTFSDPDPRVQIASQVAWKGLIDSLIQSPQQAPCTLSTGNLENQVGLCKSIKLIMTPLIPVISSRFDVSVQLSCLNTWHYMLHKLDLSVNHPSVIKIALEPILEVIFQISPDYKNLWVWNSCLDLLEDFVLSTVKDGPGNLKSKAGNLLSEGTVHGSPIDVWRDYPIKWLPWDLSQLDFLLKMIQAIMNQGFLPTVTFENRKIALNAAVRIFRSVLKGIQLELTLPSRSFDKCLLCISTILRFIMVTSENVTSKSVNVGESDLQCTVLHFLEAVMEEIENSILASPLYRVPLDIKHVNDLQSSNNEIKKFLGLCPVMYMDMVSPMVYLTVLYLCVVGLSLLDLTEHVMLMQRMQRFSHIIFSAYDCLEILHVVICLLYIYAQKLERGELCWLKLWSVFAKGLNEYIGTVNGLVCLKTDSSSTGNLMVYCFLCYPLAVMKISSKSDTCLVSTQREHEIELVVDIWKSLYDSAIRVSQLECYGMNAFGEGLCERLIGVVDENVVVLQSSIEMGSEGFNQNFGFLSVFGEFAIYVLKHLQLLDSASLRSNKSQKKGRDFKDHSNINYTLEFLSRFLGFSLMIMKTSPHAELAVISRVFAAMGCFVGHLCLKQDILLFMEIFSKPLVQWLSSSSLFTEMPEQSPIHQLQLLWTQTMDCLQRSQPAITFDSALLAVQATLLQTTLDHLHSPISDATIKFWRSTYDENSTLSYPQCLLPVLDTLWREGKIRIKKGVPAFLANQSSAVKEVVVPLQRLKVTATQKTSSKRVEFMEDNKKDVKHFRVPYTGYKRKRLELTEHQKEVRRAQQGRERDCNGHGPGVRTYTNVDFSQGNGESQESEDLRNPEAILDLLKRCS